MKKSYRILLALVSAALPLLSAHAQADFRPGYLVQPVGDTVRGEIDYRDARSNARQCRFRATPAAPVSTLLPASLRAYGLLDGSKLYRALVVPAATPAADRAPTAVFLEVLVDGPAALYLLRDEERADHYYVATATFPLTELVQRKVLLEQERVLQEQNIYRTTLAQALPGCPSAQAQLPALRFTAQALARPIVAYNACQQPAGAAPVALTPVVRQRQRARLGVVLGAKRTTMSFDAANVLYYVQHAAFGPHSAPIGGLSFSLPLSQLSRKLSLEGMLLYESQHYSAPVTNQSGFGYQFEFDLPSVRLPLLVRYTVPQGRVRPLLEAGPTLAYALHVHATVAELGATTGKPSPPTSLLPNNTRQFQQGLAAGVGVQFGAWQGRQATALLRYEGDTGWAYGQGVSTGTQHLYALLVLDLFR